jgi:hypothetical protein
MSIAFTERLAAARVDASVGTVADAYDNAWPSPRSGSSRPN